MFLFSVLEMTKNNSNTRKSVSKTNDNTVYKVLTRKLSQLNLFLWLFCIFYPEITIIETRMIYLFYMGWLFLLKYWWSDLKKDENFFWMKIVHWIFFEKQKQILNRFRYLCLWRLSPPIYSEKRGIQVNFKVHSSLL
jgi:hypothetical protein